MGGTRAVQQTYLALTRDRAIISNAVSIAGTTAITSVLGFAYWWAAIRLFPAEVVGFSSAAVSAMMLLGSIGMLGFGTVLMGELPKMPRLAVPMITSGTLMAGAVSILLGAVFAVLAPRFFAELGALSDSPLSAGLFSLGVGLTAATLVLDQSMIGLFCGGGQFWRNALFAASKLMFLVGVRFFFASTDGMVIYATWLLGNLVSLSVPVLHLAKRNAWTGRFGFDWRLYRGLTSHALGHHALNLALQAPGLALPVLVTASLSAKVNASFYAAWMIAGFAFAVPFALTTVLFPVAASNPSALARRLRLTLTLSFLSGVASSALILIGADLLLSVFGDSHVEQASGCLRILGLSVFPVIVRYHYITLSRVQGKFGQASGVMFAGGLVELVLAWFGGSSWGLTGLALGWTIAVLLESVAMTLTVFRAVLVETGAKSCSVSDALNTGDAEGRTSVVGFEDALMVDGGRK